MHYDEISLPLISESIQAPWRTEGMYAVELKFDPQEQGLLNDKVDAITWLIAALVRNGNLLEQFLLVDESKGWTVHGTAPARDAFHKANRNEFVQRAIAKLTQVHLKRPRIRFLGMVPESSAPCQCTRPKGFFLFTTFLCLEPPVRCIKCNGTFPLYRLPRPDTGEHSGLLAWQSNYQACDTLQMNCTVAERFGERQMSDPTSSLSRAGLAVCQ